MWTLEYILSQICVLVAVIFFSATYFTKSHNKVLLLTSIAALFYGLEYLLLGSLTGFVLNLIAIVRGLVFFLEKKLKNKNSVISFVIIEILIIVFGVLTWKSVCISLLPIIANVLFCYAVWQNNNFVFRIMSLIYSGIWITFNIILMSVLGIITEIAILIVEIAGFALYLRGKTLTKA